MNIFWFAPGTRGRKVARPTPRPRSSVLGAIVFLLGIRALKKRMGWLLLPELLIAVIGSAFIVAALGLDKQGVKVVGAIPHALPTFAWPQLSLGRFRTPVGERAGHCLLGPARSAGHGKKSCLSNRTGFQPESALPQHRTGQCRRQPLSLYSGFGIAHALGDQPPGRCSHPMVRDLFRGGRGV